MKKKKSTVNRRRGSHFSRCWIISSSHPPKNKLATFFSCTRSLLTWRAGSKRARRGWWGLFGTQQGRWRSGERRKSRPGHPGPVSGYLGDCRLPWRALIYSGQLLTRFLLLSPCSTLIQWMSQGQFSVAGFVMWLDELRGELMFDVL